MAVDAIEPKKRKIEDYWFDHQKAHCSVVVVGAAEEEDSALAHQNIWPLNHLTSESVLQ